MIRVMLCGGRGWRSGYVAVGGRARRAESLRALATAASPHPHPGSPRPTARLLARLLARSLARLLTGAFAGWMVRWLTSRFCTRCLCSLASWRAAVGGYCRLARRRFTAPTRPAASDRSNKAGSVGPCAARCRGGACFLGATWGWPRSSGDVASAPCLKARTRLVIFSEAERSQGARFAFRTGRGDRTHTRIDTQRMCFFHSIRIMPP